MERVRKWPEMREMPAYTMREVAQYLDIPISTARDWVSGRKGRFERVIDPAGKAPPTLSFANLVELHVLAAMRRTHKVRMKNIRAGVEAVRRRFDIKRPLADIQFQTDGVDLFVAYVGQLENVSQERRGALQFVIHEALQRIDRDAKNVPIKLYPFSRSQQFDESGQGISGPKLIVIDPKVAFGRAVVAGSGIPIDVLATRFSAGDSAESLAEDFGISLDRVEEAIRCELRGKRAA